MRQLRKTMDELLYTLSDGVGLSRLTGTSNRLTIHT